MSNYSIRQTSGSTSSVVIAGIMATQLLAAADIAAAWAKDASLSYAPYKIFAHQPSFDQVSNLFTGEFDDGTIQFVEGVSRFYAGLVATQEPLAAEFERVLADNLWALYEE